MENKQIIDVEYDKELVEKYKANYIMEEEGIGADLEAEPFDTQTKINDIPFTDMIEDGEVIIEEVADNDTNN